MDRGDLSRQRREPLVPSSDDVALPITGASSHSRRLPWLWSEQRPTYAGRNPEGRRGGGRVRRDEAGSAPLAHRLLRAVAGKRRGSAAGGAATAGKAHPGIRGPEHGAGRLTSLPLPARRPIDGGSL